MNLISRLKTLVIGNAKSLFATTDEHVKNLEFKINVDQGTLFGDISCNIAMIIAKAVGQNPREVAGKIQQALSADEHKDLLESVAIAGPGFLNMILTKKAWRQLIAEVYTQKASFFKQHNLDKKNYLIEFVSANPTGPLHLGHGRGGIIGDVLARVLSFLGHTVSKEFYINDAGNQIKLLGQSLKVRCLQQLGQSEVLPEGGYAGEYLADLAKDCVAVNGEHIKEKSDEFFELYAKEQLLNLIKADLFSYGITFDTWYSEKSLHDSGAIDRALNLLKDKALAYEHEGALWFKSTEFGDDKDRVIRKSSGELTYIAADIAYHKDKFDRGYDTLIDILGHDHHGYVRRLKATMQALGYDADKLDVILYQLVTIKEGGESVRMSKRAGTFTKLSDVIEAVGKDVARFFYLNRKSDAPLDFDLAVASKKTDENPVYYIQYAYVRINSLLQKAALEGFADWIEALKSGKSPDQEFDDVMELVSAEELALIKKVVSLSDILKSIATSQQTHLLSYYAWELAQKLHGYYTRNKVIDPSNLLLSKLRIFTVLIVHQTLDCALDLLGLSKPEKM